jgi:dienelactone hydrolase
MFTRKPHPRLEEFAITCTKALLQQNLPQPDPDRAVKAWYRLSHCMGIAPKMAQILWALFLVIAGFGTLMGTDLRAQEEETSPTSADFQKPKNKWVARLTMPRGRGPFPAVMVLHGCDGVAWHSRDWARRVESWGYATLIVDSYAPRGQKVICEDVSVVSFTKRAQDIAAGADYLRTLPTIDPNRIGAIGLSHGGSGALRAARERSGAKAASLQAIVAYYPWCPRQAAPLATDVLILIGEADDWTPAQRCLDLLEQYEKIEGRRPMVKVYPQATHAFEVRAPDRLDFGHPEKFHPTAAADSFASTRQFLDQRLRY